MIHLGILLVLAAASVREAEPHNVPRPPGVYWDGWRWRDDRVLDVDTGAGAVTYINIYGSQLGSQGSSLQTETERSSDSDMWMVVMMMYFIMSKESSSLSTTTTIHGTVGCPDCSIPSMQWDVVLKIVPVQLIRVFVKTTQSVTMNLSVAITTAISMARLPTAAALLLLGAQPSVPVV